MPLQEEAFPITYCYYCIFLYYIKCIKVTINSHYCLLCVVLSTYSNIYVFVLMTNRCLMVCIMISKRFLGKNQNAHARFSA